MCSFLYTIFYTNPIFVLFFIFYHSAIFIVIPSGIEAYGLV